LNIDTSEEQKLEPDSKKDEDFESSEGIVIKEKDQHDLIILAVITLPEQEEMAITPTEFLKLASTLIAYINYGMFSVLATQYRKTHAVKATMKNCTIHKIKLIMEFGTFNTHSSHHSHAETSRTIRRRVRLGRNVRLH